MSDAVVDNVLEEYRIIPIRDVAAALGVCERTAVKRIEEHGVPLTRLSRNIRGLLPADYGRLLAACRAPHSTINGDASK